MKSYVRELSDLGANGYPERFWLEDLQMYASMYGLQNSTFEEQLDGFLAIPAMNQLYGNDIVRDKNGKVTSARTYIRLDKVDLEDVPSCIDYIHSEMEITSNQEVNRGLDEMKFFSWDYYYYQWEFYSVCPQEFKLSMIIGVLSVSALALLFIPSWQCGVIVGLTMTMLTTDLLGFMQFFGVGVSPISYVATVMGIGLMVE